MESDLSRLANRDLRILNQITDFVAIFVIWIIVSFATIFFFGNVTIGFLGFLSIVYIFFPFIFWLYYFLFEYCFCKTIGKFITKTKVVTVNGDRPTLRHVLARTLLRSFPFEYLSYLDSLNGIHDQWSGTMVIRFPPN